MTANPAPAPAKTTLQDLLDFALNQGFHGAPIASIIPMIMELVGKSKPGMQGVGQEPPQLTPKATAAPSKGHA